MNCLTSSCALLSDDWVEGLFGKHFHSTPTEGDAGAIIQHSSMSLPAHHQPSDTPHPSNDFATGFTSNLDLGVAEVYDDSYRISPVVAPFPIATLPNISVTEPDSMAPITPIPAALATPVPPASPLEMGLGPMAISPSPPTFERKIGYETIYQHDFATRFPTHIVAQLNKRRALGALLYVIPTARVGRCTFRDPFPRSLRRARNDSGGSGRAEDQCDLCFCWISLYSLDLHRRRHFPPVWKCQDCAYYLVQNTTLEATRVMMMKHYASCRKGLPRQSEEFRLMASTGSGSPSTKPAGVEEITAPSALTRRSKRLRLMAPTNDVSSSTEPTPETLVSRAATYPTPSIDSASACQSSHNSEGMSCPPLASRITPGNNNGTLLSAALSSSLNSINITQITEAEHPEGLTEAGFVWPVTTGIHIPATHISWAGIYDQQLTFSSTPPLSSSPRNTFAPHDAADSSAAAPSLQGAFHLGTICPPPIPCPTSTIASAGCSSFDFNFDFLSASTPPSPALFPYMPPPMTPHLLFAPYAPSEALQILSLPNPEEDSSVLGQDKEKEKAQDGDIDIDWPSVATWQSVQTTCMMDFSSAQDMSIHDDAFLAQCRTDSVYGSSDWGLDTDSLQPHPNFWEIYLPGGIEDNSCTYIGKRERVESEEEYGDDTWAIESLPIAEDEIAAELMNATGEDLSGALQALIQNIQSGAGGEAYS